MTNIQSQKEGKGPIEGVSFVAHRDPMFQSPLIEKAAAGTYAIPTTPINYGPRGAGRLGLVVGGDKAVASFDVTFTVYDIDGLIIGTATTQTIAETAAGTSVLYPLNLTQQQILRGQTIVLSGNVVAAALSTILVVKLVEQSPEQEITVSGDGIATEVTAAGILAATGSSTDTPLAGNTEEGATARTQTSLLKRIVNRLISVGSILSTISGYLSSIAAYFTGVTYIDITQEITVVSAGGAGATGTLDLAALGITDFRLIDEFIIHAWRKTSGQFKSAAATENMLTLRASGVPFYGNANGIINSITGAAGDFTMFGLRWSNSVYSTTSTNWTWQAIGSGVTYGGNILMVPYFQTVLLDYLFKADANDFTAVIHIHAKKYSK